MIEGTTESGFEYKISKNRLDNYELLEVIAEIDESPLALPKVIDLLLGDEKERLKDHLRTEDNLVPASDLMEEIKEIFNNHTEVKN